MGALMIHMCIVALLGASLCDAAPISGSLEVVRSPVSVHRGHTTILPCWLNPPQSAEGLEVRWYRSDRYDTPVMFYRERKFESASQDASYVGRVSFGLKDAASEGLKAGDVSLKLENVTIEDAGDYTCYVSSDQGYDRGSVTLVVTEIGNAPLLSAVWKQDNMVNMSCESEGWYPQPNLRWSDQKQVLTPKSLKFSKDSSGLQSVHSWILVPSSTEVSCSVGFSAEEAKEARVHVETPPQPESGSSAAGAAGWVAFAIVVIAAILGALYYKMRGKKAESGSDQGKKAESGSDQENEKLVPKEVIQPTDLSTASKHYVNVTLDEKENEYLTVKNGHKLRDRQCEFPDGEKVTCLTAIKGTPGFSSGQHYWEVRLTAPNVGLKQSWWVGVTSATDISQEGFDPTSSNGFWFLSSSPERADSFQFSTHPRVSLPFDSRPETVGVYLNYDSGELSFYNVEKGRLIGSLTAKFTGEVFPFFNPGKGDKAIMEILQRPEQGSDTGNSVHSPAEEA
ncbi:butyrophilin subfamily 1 member A1-like [Centropristis striata]|uniref:butyrophilin subfamily 1 member A1-like n=1 Tax=Centropristis striata TaxID=184440 RepID=UPI0027DF8EB3|nr:butyrophilin subfamily 1 member A1-like [Centropristis striata]